FGGGRVYEHATKAYVGQFHGKLHGKVVGVYTDSLQFVWQVAIRICGVAFLLVGLERHYELRKTVESKFGIAEEDENRETKQV
ncbi:hypothetical protein GQ43DRAFT_370273, partial [Delitschia confertaspora ATCC 74209]